LLFQSRLSTCFLELHDLEFSLISSANFLSRLPNSCISSSISIFRILLPLYLAELNLRPFRIFESIG
ncbi:hypothetical protein GIB67_011540, partial [Kingdonia uniflora]